MDITSAASRKLLLGSGNTNTINEMRNTKKEYEKRNTESGERKTKHKTRKTENERQNTEEPGGCIILLQKAFFAISLVYRTLHPKILSNL